MSNGHITLGMGGSNKQKMALSSDTSSRESDTPALQGSEISVVGEVQKEAILVSEDYSVHHQDTNDQAEMAETKHHELDDEIFELGGGNDLDDEDVQNEDDTNVQAFSAQSDLLPSSTAWSVQQQVPTRLQDLEVLTQHPTDPTLIVSTYTVTDPYNSGVYIQTDNIPQIDTSAQPSGTFYFVPLLENAPIPRKDPNGRLWQFSPSQNQWVHPNGKVWKPIILFRRFDTATHRYIDAYNSVPKLQNVDPNNPTYSGAYNKWVKQIQRRRDSTYTPTVFKDHWTPVERWVLYDSINYLCHLHGAEIFGFQFDGGEWGDPEMEFIAQRINAAAGGARNKDSVRGQIVTAHERKNKAVFELLGRVRQLRADLEAGRVLAVAEQFPENAIAIADFPTVHQSPMPAGRLSLTSLPEHVAPAATPKPKKKGNQVVETIKEEVEAEEDTEVTIVDKDSAEAGGTSFAALTSTEEEKAVKH